MNGKSVRNSNAFKDEESMSAMTQSVLNIKITPKQGQSYKQAQVLDLNKALEKMNTE